MTTEKLTMLALKQHDRIHPSLKAITGSGQIADHKEVQAAAAKEEASKRRRRLTSTGESASTKSGPSAQQQGPPKMSIFRLVAATRAWQRLAKRRQPPQPKVHLENTYQLGPDDKHKLFTGQVQHLLEEVLEAKLRNVEYSPEKCRRLSTELSAHIKARVKAMDFPRYKIVCNVILMENQQQGMEVASRCIWEPSTDSFATHTHRSRSLIAIAFVHGVYFE